MKKALAAMAVTMVALTACASARSLGQGPSPSPSPTPTATPTPTPSPTPSSPSPTPSKPSATPCATKRGGTFDPTSNFVGGQLVDVRVGGHDTYDRVTFEFSGQDTVPPFEIRPATRVIEDGSGKPLALRGGRFAEIVFQHASGYDLYYQPTYSGPKDFLPGLPALAELRQAGDFERVLSWGFGLRGSGCWTVTELSGPVRLAVDFAH